ncbi:MAG: hypothetical protein R3F11_09950 [Verrucomicrobiales bacterium]
MTHFVDLQKVFGGDDNRDPEFDELAAGARLIEGGLSGIPAATLWLDRFADFIEARSMTRGSRSPAKAKGSAKTDPGRRKTRQGRLSEPSGGSTPMAGCRPDSLARHPAGILEAGGRSESLPRRPDRWDSGPCLWQSGEPQGTKKIPAGVTRRRKPRWQG